ncbi:hypothetical protein V8E36_000032, partial [Tilletia maclaganii]
MDEREKVKQGLEKTTSFPLCCGKKGGLQLGNRRKLLLNTLFFTAATLSGDSFLLLQLASRLRRWAEAWIPYGAAAALVVLECNFGRPRWRNAAGSSRKQCRGDIVGSCGRRGRGSAESRAVLMDFLARPPF